MNVVFAGGGTGGHLYPAIAIADALGARATIAFVGTSDRLERTLVPQAGYRLHVVRARPLARGMSFELVRTVWANVIGTLQSLRLLGKLRPDITIATGGYVCFPVVLAARLRRALGVSRGRIVLLEPNAHAGLTSRLLAPLVDEVWGAFEPSDARAARRFVRTGVPVRAALRALPPREAACTRLGLNPRYRTLLALGGSQGARSINDALVGLLQRGGLPTGWQLLHLTGDAEYDRVRAELGRETGGVVRPYMHDIADAYAAADLVLARAGASTLGELAAIGRPAILVPYPFAADDHQTRNAEAFAAGGAAVTLADRELSADRLARLLADVARPERLAAMRSAAAARESDPSAVILARIDALLARKGAA